MRKFSKKELYSGMLKGSSLGAIISSGGFYLGAHLLSESTVPMITSTACLATSFL